MTAARAIAREAAAARLAQGKRPQVTVEVKCGDPLGKVRQRSFPIANDGMRRPAPRVLLSASAVLGQIHGVAGMLPLA